MKSAIERRYTNELDELAAYAEQFGIASVGFQHQLRTDIANGRLLQVLNDHRLSRIVFRRIDSSGGVSEVMVSGEEYGFSRSACPFPASPAVGESAVNLYYAEDYYYAKYIRAVECHGNVVVHFEVVVCLDDPFEFDYAGEL